MGPPRPFGDASSAPLGTPGHPRAAPRYTKPGSPREKKSCRKPGFVYLWARVIRTNYFHFLSQSIHSEKIFSAEIFSGAGKIFSDSDFWGKFAHGPISTP